MHLGRLVIFLSALGLAGCGVDGPPEPPEPREERPTGASITLSGEAGIGVVGSS